MSTGNDHGLDLLALDEAAVKKWTEGDPGDYFLEKHEVASAQAIAAHITARLDGEKPPGLHIYRARAALNSYVTLVMDEPGEKAKALLQRLQERTPYPTALADGNAVRFPNIFPLAEAVAQPSPETPPMALGGLSRAVRRLTPGDRQALHRLLDDLDPPGGSGSVNQR